MNDVISEKQIFEVLHNYKTIKVSDNMRVSSEYDIDYHVLRIIVEKMVLALKEDTVEMSVLDDYETPTSTWQMFKAVHCDSWWMRWFVKRRPIRYDTHYLNIPVEVDRYQTFPDAGVDLLNPEILGKPVRLDLLRRL